MDLSMKKSFGKKKMTNFSPKFHVQLQIPLPSSSPNIETQSLRWTRTSSPQVKVVASHLSITVELTPIMALTTTVDVVVIGINFLSLSKGFVLLDHQSYLPLPAKFRLAPLVALPFIAKSCYFVIAHKWFLY